MVLALARPLVTFDDCDQISGPPEPERPGPAYRPSYQGGCTNVWPSALSNGNCCCGDHEFQRRHRANIAAVLTATQVEKWTTKQWEAAKKEWSKDKKKWADCRKQSRDQKLEGRKSWSFLYKCMTS